MGGDVNSNKSNCGRTRIPLSVLEDLRKISTEDRTNLRELTYTSPLSRMTLFRRLKDSHLEIENNIERVKWVMACINWKIEMFSSMMN